MNKSFTDVFPGLKAEPAVSGVFRFIEVSRMMYSKDRRYLLIYADISRLVDKKTIRKVEHVIDEQILKNVPAETRMHARIIEHYILPESYTFKALFEEYKESLLLEFAEEEKVLSRFLNKAAFRVEEDHRLVIETENHPVAREGAKVWIDRITRIFNERFGYEVSVSVEFPKETDLSFLKNRIEDDTAARERARRKYQKEKEEAQKTDTSELMDIPAEKNEVKKQRKAAEKKEQPAKTEQKQETNAFVKPGSLNRSRKEEGEVRFRRRTYVSDDPSVIYGRNFDDEVKTIASYGNDEGQMVIEGVIFSQEVRELRNGERSILSFAVTDYTDSIMCKLFVANEDVKELSGKLADGKKIRMKGLAQYDTYDRELSIRSVQGIRTIDRNFNIPREDHAAVKRVELHCHSKMSENDGLAEVKDIINTSKSWGHKAVALTDHGCVYGFTEAFHALKDDSIKVIYGMEGYLVDDTKETVIRPGDLTLDAPFVVFDIETTGFSPIKNRIIEIGAVKVQDGKILDRFSEFINPGVPIPYRIEELTHISDVMVKDADPVEKVLPKFLDFCAGCCLVAHNAEFDIGFIEENARRLTGKTPEFTSVDTIGMARPLLPKLNNYRLETVARELKISLENHHRAVDDAECTAHIFLKLAERWKSRNVITLEELKNSTEPDAEAIKKMATYHIILLASNEQGLINLYHLVSDSSLIYYNRRPRIPKSLLQKNREGIIIGSACSAGELFTAVLEGASEAELKRIVEFYDYLEIQPLGNDEYLIQEGRHDINSYDDIIEINKKIVDLGMQYNKPVCATTDAHFVNPEDGIYRTMLQAGCGYKESDTAPPLYLRTTEEMLHEFEYLGAEKAYEVVVTNTNLIADRIEKIEPVRPDKCPPVIENADEDLRNICYNTVHKLYGENPPEIVTARLDRELNSIISNGYAVMYIIAQKLVNKSVKDGYLVGSRGSVGSSFAATMAGITEVNPLRPHYRCPKCRYSDFDSEDVKKYESVTGADMPDKACPVCGTNMTKDGFNIPFETFLGFKGNKEPDIDLNFSGEYQAKAHAYTEVIFGKGQTFKAGTVGTVAEKTAIGYVLHYYEDNQIEKRRCEITRIAHHLEGVRRTSGQHPGGIIVLPFGEDINTFTPVQHPANDQTTSIVTTHFDYHSIDHNLLKLDILGHDDPTMIRMLQDLTGVDPRTFPLDSKEVMSLFQNTSALGVTPEEIRGCPLGAMGLPEFGTENAINMLMETKPQSVSDLIRISGLSHGTNVWHGNAQTLIQEGKCKIDTAVCTRDDIMVYLISMGIENETAFKIMEKVRKGVVAKGKCGEWPEWKQLMLDHNVPDWYIWSCERIEYMFPKAHAAAYVMMALRIAYCKVFYPLAYYCAYYSIRANGFDYELMCLGKETLEHHIDDYESRKDKLSAKEADELRDMKICQEMYARGYTFVPIDIYQASAARFKICNDKALMPSLRSISGMGEIAADGIEIAAKQGPFTSIADFRDRSKLSQTIVDKMKALHLLDGLPATDQFSLFDQF